VRSAGDRARARAYFRDFWPGILGYLLVLTVVIHWGDLKGSSPWRFVWALLPVIPMAWLVRAVVRHLRRVDDHQRELLLQGVAVGFGVAMIAGLAAGFLAFAGLALPATGWIIFVAGMMGMAVGTGFAHHRG
jgi:hypothetical protein